MNTKKKYEKRESKKKYIIDSTIKAWAEKGLYNLKVEDVSETADIAKGLIYSYFETFDDLILETLNFVMFEFIKFIQTVEKEAAEKEYKEKLQFLCVKICQYILSKNNQNIRKILINA